MTQDEYNAALQSGSTKVEAPDDSSTSSGSGSQPAAPASPGGAATAQAESQTSIDQFLPILVALQSTQKYLSAAPTFIPQTFQDQIQFVFDGTNYSIYFYFNNQWNQMKIVTTGLATASGTDTATLNTHSGSVTHTITHGLTRPAKVIMATTQLNPNGVAGGSTNKGVAVGDIILDGSGNVIGGTYQSVLTGSPAGVFSYVTFAALAGLVNAGTTTTGGTANMSVTVNNVTPTTFDIVYSVSDNGVSGPPVQNFSVTWVAMG